MSEPFVGRREELHFLERAHSGPESALIPIYGRRRVGKSELILHFMKSRGGVYFLGKQAAAGMQLREFFREAAVALDQPLLAAVEPRDWKSALTAVAESASGTGKLILVFDEFQWTVEASPELPSVLQELWDRTWRGSGRIMVILCGSYVGFMEREVLGRRSPLFGRRTGQIHLKPFGYREAALFHPAWSLTDRARAYFVCGGVPLYLRSFSTDASIEMNIARTLLDPYAPLYVEPEFLLREELREVENYYAVLLAVAAGHVANRAISEQSGIGERSLHYYLKQLVDLGYLAQRHPLVGGRPVVRHVRYVLEDPLLRFWFRFVYPNTSFITAMGGRRALRDRIRPHLDAYFGSCFERLCREALPALYHQEGVTAGFEVGAYWDKHAQIDVVGLREDGWTDLGECKWGAVRSAKRLLEELEQKVRRYPNPRNATIARRVFTRSGRPRDVPGAEARWHSLEDLYSV